MRGREGEAACGLWIFMGRCHRAERVPRGWQRPGALILLPTQRWWRGFSGRSCCFNLSLQKPSASTGRLSYLIITELQKTVFQSRAGRSSSLSRPTDLLGGVGRQQREGLQYPAPPLQIQHPENPSAPSTHRQNVLQVHGQQKEDSSSCFFPASTHQHRLFQDLIMGQ